MAKKESKTAEDLPLEEVEVAPAPASKSDRQTRWEKHVANYKLSNPVKGARKEANGEFAKIPDTFR